LRAARQRDFPNHAGKVPRDLFPNLVKLALVHRVELGQPKEFDKPRTKKEALAQLEERVRPQGRRAFEGFLRKMERLEVKQNGYAHADCGSCLPGRNAASAAPTLTRQK
jgi:hypothetical protein